MTSTAIIHVVILFVAVVFLAGMTGAQETNHHEHLIHEKPVPQHGQNWTCRELKIHLQHLQFEGLDNCTNHMKFKNWQDRSDKVDCIIKCVLENEGVFSNEGTVRKDVLERKMDELAPDNVRKRAEELIDGCVDKYGPGLDPKEEYCKSYAVFASCFWNVIKTICP